MKKAQIISIGNELLIGDTVNTNAAKIGNRLTGMGFEVAKVVTIPDRYSVIKKTIGESLDQCDLTITTGGLGPTHDDITKKAVADLFHSNLTTDRNVLNHIRRIFEKRGYTLSKNNVEQAEVPEVCEVLFNEQGTAPGMWFERNGSYLAVLPGVPHEMEYLMEYRITPKLKKVFPGTEIRLTEYYKTAGIPESSLSEQIGDLEEFISNGVEIAYLPSSGGVTIRISAEGATAELAEQKVIQLRKLLTQKAGEVIYGKGKETTLEEVVGQILTGKKWTIATAESCTGGLLAHRLTNIPGSSAYMKGGVVAYANEIKTDILNVNRKTIEEKGAVSMEVALQMAEGAAKAFGADIGVSTTGIAGPGGGTDEKPVGLVWMGFWIRSEHFALKSMFTNNRLINKERTVAVVLECIRRQLQGIGSFPYNIKPVRP